jgi:crossover junction endodeoxyribonuclease RuvC
VIRILGFDPGTRVCGYGVLDLEPMTRTMRFVECGTLEPGAGSAAERLGVLGRDAAEVVEEFRPDAGAIEMAHVGINPHAALRLAESRGVLLQLLVSEGIPVEQYQPSTVKLSVAGHGRASKDIVAQVVMRSLNLARPPKLDATDALAIAMCRALRWRAAA